MAKLHKIQSNFHEVVMGLATYYFSYETCIAVQDENGLKISNNNWSNTTGKHLNWIDSDKNKRISHKELVEYLKNKKGLV